MRLFLIRHAESLGNQEGRLQGRREFPLTERGVRQAQALGVRLASLPLAAIYASPIRRAMDTAQEIASRAGLEVKIDGRLQEYDFGQELSGLTWQEIREKQPQVVAALISNKREFPRYPGEEGRERFRDRVCAVVEEIANRHKSHESVAVVTHAGPVVVYVMEALGREYGRPIPFSVDNASITTIEINRPATPFQPEAVVVGVNDTCHLMNIEGPARPRVDSERRAP